MMINIKPFVFSVPLRYFFQGMLKSCAETTKVEVFVRVPLINAYMHEKCE